MIDAPTIAAGFLHDTVEDCKDITLDTIRAEFGEEVAQLVDGVTKLDKLDFTNREEQKAESLRKMILAMSKDIRVVIIKLADRLHNMRTLRFQPEERQKAIAHETLDIYAPLAHRLGMNSIKSELEDLSFKYIDPKPFTTSPRRWASDAPSARKTSAWSSPSCPKSSTRSTSTTRWTAAPSTCIPSTRR